MPKFIRWTLMAVVAAGCAEPTQSGPRIPVIEILSPQTGAYVSGVEQVVDVRVVDDGTIESVWVEGGQEAAVAWPRARREVRLQLNVKLRDGRAMLRVRAIDDEQNLSVDSVRVSLDREPPRLRAAFPAVTSAPNGRIMAIVQDQWGWGALDRATIRVGSGAEQTALTLSGTDTATLMVPVTGLAEGVNQVTLRTYDRAGNYSEVTSHVLRGAEPLEVIPRYTGACARLADRTVWCWRYPNYIGSHFQDGLAPYKISGDLRFDYFATGYCGIAAGKTYCWGRLGGQYPPYPDAPLPAEPTLITPVPPGATWVYGGQLGCAADASQRLTCWEGPVITPMPAPLTGPVRQYNNYWSYGCVVTTADAALCWGENYRAQLGDGTVVDRATPTPVHGGHHFRSVYTAQQHTCGLTTAGLAYCWGFFDRGQTGTGQAWHGVRTEPGAVGGGRVYEALGVGYEHSCAITPEGELWCWGSIGGGQGGRFPFGAGAHFVAEPVPGPDAIRFRTLGVDLNLTCGVTRDASPAAFCYGEPAWLEGAAPGAAPLASRAPRAPIPGARDQYGW